MERWIQTALDLGFTAAVPLDIATLKPLPSVRDMCAADKCRAYGKNWTCPPACGTLEECNARMHSYTRGILLQTTGQMAKAIDSRAYARTERQHNENFRAYAELLKKEYPDALCLGAGGCRVCKNCAYPDPCRSPEKAYSSLEGYGLFVTQLCRDNRVPYYYGEKTITYTACVLF